MFLPSVPPVAFWKLTCVPLPDPALVVARVQNDFIPGQGAEGVGGFPTLPSNSFAADKCWFTRRAPAQNSFSCAGKFFLSQAGSEVGCGNPCCSPGCVWGQLLCAQAIFSPTDSHSLGQAKIPLLQMQVHCPAGNGPIKKSFTRHKRVCVPLDWDLPRLYHKLECFLEECKERGGEKKKKIKWNIL